jgi:radical SAM protein with 4Fe4S-binding SPASM domain
VTSDILARRECVPGRLRQLVVAGWEITRKCNFRCRHCFTSSGAALPNELTTDECRDLLDQIAAMKVPIVSWSGGEPLLREDLITLMEYGLKKGIREFTLVSNGFLVKKDTLARLKKAGLTSFQVSLDGATPQQMEAIRGGGSKAFDRALRAVRCAREVGVYTVIGTFIHPRNVASLPDIVALALRENVDLMRLSGFVPIGRGESPEIIRENTLSEEQKDLLARFVIDEIINRRSGLAVLPDHAFGPFMEDFRCEAGMSTAYIGAGGDIHPCPTLARSEFLVGNIRQRSLEEIWNDPKMLISRSIDYRRIGGECGECRHLERCRGGCRGMTFNFTGSLEAAFPGCFVSRIERLRGAGASKDTRAAPVRIQMEAPVSLMFQDQMQQSYRRHAERSGQMLANPYPRYLTRNCNLACAHCATPRTTWDSLRELTTEQAKSIFSAFAREYPPTSVQMLAVSGGEPLLRDDIVEMVRFLTSLGYPVGLDSNGVLLGKKPDMIDRLVEAGLRYPCLSIDGLERNHDRLRGAPSFEAVRSALSYITKRHPLVPLQTITMVTPQNIGELPEIFRLLEDLGVRCARFSTIYRCGRALEHPENFLDDLLLARLLHWIAGRRQLYFDGGTSLLIEFTDDGWCGRTTGGTGMEGIVRNSFFFCQAGISLAVVNYDGDLSACLSLPPERSRQGSLLNTSFRELWENRFVEFRRRGRFFRGPCTSCAEWNFCLGGAMHHRSKEGDLLECPHLRLRGIAVQ